MKRLGVALFILALLAILRNASGQGFVNLDFEQAVITPDPSSSYYPYAVSADDAIPGWTAVGFLSPNDISFDDLSLGATSVTLCGTNSPYSPSSLHGLFSIDLYGGVSGPAAGASITQTGLVAGDAASLLFIAQGNPQFGPLLVSLGGQNIPLYAISTGPNYTTYGGDISGFAGRVEQLTFTAPQGVNNYWELDNIQFSSSPIPEPRLFLPGVCFLAFCWCAKLRLAAPHRHDQKPGE